MKLFEAMCNAHNIDMDKPIKELSKKEMNVIFYGSDKKFKFKIDRKSISYNGDRVFEGLVNSIKRQYKESFSEAIKEDYEAKYMIDKTCKTCNGKRLKDVVLAITINIL